MKSALKLILALIFVSVFCRAYSQTSYSTEGLGNLECSYFLSDPDRTKALQERAPVSDLSVLEWTPDFIEFRHEVPGGCAVSVYGIEWNRKKSSFDLSYQRGKGEYATKEDWCKTENLFGSGIEGEYVAYHPDGSLKFTRVETARGDSLIVFASEYDTEGNAAETERTFVDGEVVDFRSQDRRWQYTYCDNDAIIHDVTWKWQGATALQRISTWKRGSTVLAQRHSPILTLDHGSLAAIWSSQNSPYFKMQTTSSHQVHNLGLEENSMRLIDPSEQGELVFDSFEPSLADQNIRFALSGPGQFQNCGLSRNSVTFKMTGNSHLSVSSIYSENLNQIDVQYVKNGIIRKSKSLKHNEDGFQMNMGYTNIVAAFEEGELIVQCNQHQFLSVETDEVFAGTTLFGATGCSESYLYPVTFTSFAMDKWFLTNTECADEYLITPSSEQFNLGAKNREWMSTARSVGNYRRDGGLAQIIFGSESNCTALQKAEFKAEVGLVIGDDKQLVEREEVGSMRKELELSMSGLVSNGKSVSAGDWGGANEVIIADLTCGSNYLANVRVVDIESSEVTYRYVNSSPKRSGIHLLLSDFGD